MDQNTGTRPFYQFPLQKFFDFCKLFSQFIFLLNFIFNFFSLIFNKLGTKANFFSSKSIADSKYCCIFALSNKNKSI